MDMRRLSICHNILTNQVPKYQLTRDFYIKNIIVYSEEMSEKECTFKNVNLLIYILRSLLAIIYVHKTIP